MRTMANYLIIMLTIILFVFRLVVVFTTSMEMDFMVQSINVDYEIALLFVMLLSIILMSKNKLLGPIILSVASLIYYGPDLLSKINLMATTTISVETALEAVISMVGVIIPVFAFFIIAFAKEQEKRPVDKKTDFFYKNEAYDRKYDERADRNNYRTM